MAQQNETKGTTSTSSRRALFATALILLVLLFVVTLIAGLGVVLIGRIITLVFGLGLFEASLIALGTALGISYFLLQVLRPQSPLPSSWYADDSEDEEDWDEDDWEDEEEDVIIPPHSRNDPCPCGSGRKYKNCHGR